MAPFSVRARRKRAEKDRGNGCRRSGPPAAGRIARTVGRSLRAAVLPALLLLSPAATAMAATPAEHAAIQGPFSSLTEVTAACLQCHPRAGADILASVHWRWQRQRSIDGRMVSYAKLDGLTNFGIVAGSNPDRCLACHVSIAPTPETMAAARPETIDCLVCHDTSGSYRRGTTPVPADLLRMARGAGRPGPANCRTCHSPSCGLGAGLERTDFDADIHLSSRGAGMRCQDCHPSGGRHRMQRRLEKDQGIRQATGCRACHTDNPHSLDQLNQHAELISCQTCHIPAAGRTRPVIIGWNWLLAGKTPGLFLDAPGRRAPLLTGGGFLLASGVEPVYRWDDGSDRVYRRGDRIAPDRATILQEPGERKPDSRIHPFTVEYGTQLYDAKYRYLISPRLATGSGAMFPDKDWETIARAGMNSFRLPYSGRHDFTATVTYRRLDHGTVPASRALGCMDCHGSTTRMDWQNLGYEQDPWQEAQPPRPPVAGPPEAGPDMVPGKELPPVRETILPVGPDR